MVTTPDLQSESKFTIQEYAGLVNMHVFLPGEMKNCSDWLAGCQFLPDNGTPMMYLVKKFIW